MKRPVVLLFLFQFCCLNCGKEMDKPGSDTEALFANRDWASVGNGVFNSAVEGIAVYNNKIIVTGNFTTINGNAFNRIAGLDRPTTWQPLGSGLNATAENLIVFNNELYVGGFFTQAGGSSCNFIAKWNGSNWAPVKGGLNRPVRSLHIFNNELVVGGSFRVAGVGANNVQANFIARWDGSEWKS
jgi:trimeric autotransporter adhesin